MQGQTFPVALDNTSVPSSLVQQSPTAGPSPMRRHLAQSSEFTSDTSAASDDSGDDDDDDDDDDPDIFPPSSSEATSTDTATGMDSSARTVSGSPNGDSPGSSGGIQTTSATSGSARASTNGSSNSGSPAAAPSGSPLTSVLTQPAVSFSSAFFATCNGSYACSTTTGLALSAAWVRPEHLKAVAMAFDCLPLRSQCNWAASSQFVLSSFA
ncbi:hypothetical protein WJX74_010731 [Apatococcus lobatus]|uniref:Uncharacterized protein n=1 Tax=Apatococcus lobatus TaxID=904363 RepID=A0AAW1QAA3_9CHLO